ncbi:MAG: TonB family protein [Saprospiraceae bacterium]
MELLKFVQKNLKYPAIAKENGVQGTIPISFTVGKDGSITDVTVLRGIRCWIG